MINCLQLSFITKKKKKVLLKTHRQGVKILNQIKYFKTKKKSNELKLYTVI
jgi:hypothetical protein